MVAERHRPRHPQLGLTAAGAAGNPRVITVAEGGDPLPQADHASPSPFSTLDGGGARRAGTPDGASSELRPATLALTISGVSAAVIADSAPAFEAVGLQAVQGGGGRVGSPPGAAAERRVEPGSAVGVELIRGDMSAVGTGTVTFVEGNDVLAFGHPLMGAGEIYLPLVDAEIHGILPSLSQSFKLSSPIHEVGSLVQDRPSCIVGDLSLRSSMIPIVIQVSAPHAPPRSFAAEVARNRRLTPTLLALVATSAVSDAEPTATT